MAKEKKPPAGPAPELVDYHQKAEALSKARDSLGQRFRMLQLRLQEITDKHMPEIRAAAREVAKQHADLADMIKAKPELFNKPRTYVTAGLKFGMVKKPGKLSWDDDAKVCKRIRDMVNQKVITRVMGDMAIKVTEKPVAAVLDTLTADVLKRIGVTVGTDSDEAIIKAVDSEVEKAINGLITEATGDTNAEVAV